MEELRELRASLRTCEEALNRSLTHSKALKAKIDFQRVSITTLESRLARERRNVEMLKDYGPKQRRVVNRIWTEIKVR